MASACEAPQNLWNVASYCPLADRLSCEEVLQRWLFGLKSLLVLADVWQHATSLHPFWSIFLLRRVFRIENHYSIAMKHLADFKYICMCSGVLRGGRVGCSTPPLNSEVLTKLSRNSLKVPKIKKIALCEMKYLVQNYSCLQNPWLGGYRPQIPVLSVLCPQLNLLNPPPPPLIIVGCTVNKTLNFGARVSDGYASRFRNYFTNCRYSIRISHTFYSLSKLFRVSQKNMF
jgi:hypothetical protein